MNYLEFLQEQFSDYEVVAEQNLIHDNNTIIYKKLNGGGVYKESTVQPIQLICWSDDVETAIGDLQTFATAQSMETFINDLDYYKQFFNTPVIISNINQRANNYQGKVIMNGTLIISSNLSDITKVEIDGVEYYPTVAPQINYKTLEDEQRSNSVKLDTTNILQGSIEILMTIENKNNDIGTKARRIREGTLSLDTTYTVELTFSDNEYVETYSMKLTSYSLVTSTSGIPIINLAFRG